MQHHADPRGSASQRLGLQGLVFAIYVLAGKLGLSLAFVHASASAVWPPTGIAIAALILTKQRLWPAILAGAFVVNMTTSGSDRKSTRLNSSHSQISYAVFCLKKKKK